MRNDNNANTTAYLSNKGRYTTFAFKDKRITFLTSKILVRYTKVLSWDNGYIEVMTRKQGKPKAEEDYIDLIPILKNLYIEPSSFIKPIKEVKIKYGREQEI